VRIKTVSVGDILTRMAQSLESMSGVLPHGTLFYSGASSSYWVGVEVLATVRRTMFNTADHGAFTATIPFPETVFLFYVDREKIVQSKLFACIPPIGRRNDQLFRFPFGNVYEDGKICWGNIVLPR